MVEKIIIFDTTMRDGEQSPGATMNLREKVLIAKSLEEMNVDVIEAGFPASSEGDFNSVSEISSFVKESIVCGLARAVKSDIEKAGFAIKKAKRGRIHTFISTSNIHLEYQIKKSKNQILEMIQDSVSFSRNYTDDVEWSAMDATRSDKEFLFKAIEVAIKSGATTINIPDTVGYSFPSEYYNLILDIKNNIPNIDKAVISCHCQNDLGLATANSLAAIEAGARQVECTINGLGERAGNTALEEVVMILKTRKDYYSNFYTNINTKKIYRISKLVSNITGMTVQSNKAIVGRNAFAHESGIHQDGVLKNPNTYEIINPDSIGLANSSLVLGKHSGRAAFKSKLKEMGHELSDRIIENIFVKFKDLADKKKEILEEDLISLVDGLYLSKNKKVSLQDIDVEIKNKITEIKISLIVNNQKKLLHYNSKFGPIHAIFEAISKLTNTNFKLDLYQVNSVTEGIDAQATTIVRLRDTKNNKVFTGSGYDINVLLASAKAYINCLNKII